MKNFVNDLFTQLNWVDVAVFALLLFSLIVGLIRGFFVQVAGIIGVFAALAVALHFGAPVSEWAENTLSLTQKTSVILTFAVLFLGVWIGWLVISHLLKKLMMKMKFGTFDRFLGGAFGLVKGALVAYVILVLVDGFVPGLNDQIATSVSNKGVARVDGFLLDQKERIPEPAWKVIAGLRKEQLERIEAERREKQPEQPTNP